MRTEPMITPSSAVSCEWWKCQRAVASAIEIPAILQAVSSLSSAVGIAATVREISAVLLLPSMPTLAFPPP